MNSLPYPLYYPLLLTLIPYYTPPPPPSIPPNPGTTTRNTKPTHPTYLPSSLSNNRSVNQIDTHCKRHGTYHIYFLIHTPSFILLLIININIKKSKPKPMF